MRKLRPCLNCGKETRNEKYCSHSCSAKIVNIGVRRHGSDPNKCLNCGNDTRNKKYCSAKCQHKHKEILAFEDILKTGKLIDSTWSISPTSKRFLISHRGMRCEVCGNSQWNDKDIPLQIHHINGKSNDNRLENVSLLCLNCHAQTETFGAKNKGNSDRVLRYKMR